MPIARYVIRSRALDAGLSMRRAEQVSAAVQARDIVLIERLVWKVKATIPASVERRLVARILQRLGQREKLHPQDVLALGAKTDPAARLLNAINAAVYGHEPIGVVQTRGGYVGLCDMRPWLRSTGVPVTDPGLPDLHSGRPVPAPAAKDQPR